MEAKDIPREKLTPLPKNFEDKIKKCVEENKTPYVLLNTGSYCPVHPGHLLFLANIKKFLEQNFNIIVLGGYISPSHDDYVSSKAQGYGFEDFFINFEDRCKLIEFTREIVKDDIEILIDKWEGSQEGFVDFPSVWASTQYYFDQVYEKLKLPTKVVVAYCIGDDMLKTSIDKYHDKLTHLESTYDLPLIIVGRNSKMESSSIRNKIQVYKNYSYEDMIKKKLFYIPGQEYAETSSSLIRKLIIQGASDQELCKHAHPKVADFLKKQYEASQNKN